MKEVLKVNTRKLFLQAAETPSGMIFHYSSKASNNPDFTHVISEMNSSMINYTSAIGAPGPRQGRESCIAAFLRLFRVSEGLLGACWSQLVPSCKKIPTTDKASLSLEATASLRLSNDDL